MEPDSLIRKYKLYRFGISTDYDYMFEILDEKLTKLDSSVVDYGMNGIYRRYYKKEDIIVFYHDLKNDIIWYVEDFVYVELINLSFKIIEIEKILRCVIFRNLKMDKRVILW